MAFFGFLGLKTKYIEKQCRITLLHNFAESLIFLCFWGVGTSAPKIATARLLLAPCFSSTGCAVKFCNFNRRQSKGGRSILSVRSSPVKADLDDSRSKGRPCRSLVAFLSLQLRIHAPLGWRWCHETCSSGGARHLKRLLKTVAVILPASASWSPYPSVGECGVRLLPVSGGAIRLNRCGRGAPRPTARASAPRLGHPSIGPRVAHDLTRGRRPPSDRGRRFRSGADLCGLSRCHRAGMHGSSPCMTTPGPVG
jgi:hypothetical protein